MGKKHKSKEEKVLTKDVAALLEKKSCLSQALSKTKAFLISTELWAILIGASASTLYYKGTDGAPVLIRINAIGSNVIEGVFLQHKRLKLTKKYFLVMRMRLLMLQQKMKLVGKLV